VPSDPRWLDYSLLPTPEEMEAQIEIQRLDAEWVPPPALPRKLRKVTRTSRGENIK